MSWDVISCDELWWEVELWGFVMSSGALCIAPATPGSVPVYGWLPGKRQPRASGSHRAVAPPESSVYCACHAQVKCGGSVYCACQAKAAAGQRRPPRRSSSRNLCVLRLPRKREVRRLCVLSLPGKGSRGPAAATAYCACQAKGSRGPAAATAPQLLQKAVCTAPATQKGSANVLCTAPAKQRQPRARRPARRSSSRKLCVLRLPRKRSVRRLCVLRLPGKRQPRASGGHRAAAPTESSVYCACHAKGKGERSEYCACQATRASGGHRAAAPPESSVYYTCHAKGLCGGSVYYAWQAKGSRGPAAATAPQLLQKPLCTAPATQKGSANVLCTSPARQRQPRASGGQRAAAPLESSVYCACQAKGSRGPAAATAPQLLQKALCTAPARQKAVMGQWWLPRRSSARRLCVLRLPRERQPGSSLYCASEWVSEWWDEWDEWRWVSEWVGEWVSEVSEWVRVSEGVSEGAEEAEAEEAEAKERSGAPAGSKRKTRTPHSDVGNTNNTNTRGYIWLYDGIKTYFIDITYLVGGIPTPLKNISQLGCSKPPTSCVFFCIFCCNHEASRFKLPHFFCDQQSMGRVPIKS